MAAKPLSGFLEMSQVPFLGSRLEPLGRSFSCQAAVVSRRRGKPRGRKKNSPGDERSPDQVDVGGWILDSESHEPADSGCAEANWVAFCHMEPKKILIDIFPSLLSVKLAYAKAEQKLVLQFPCQAPCEGG